MVYGVCLIRVLYRKIIFIEGLFLDKLNLNFFLKGIFLGFIGKRGCLIFMIFVSMSCLFFDGLVFKYNLVNFIGV